MCARRGEEARTERWCRWKKTRGCADDEVGTSSGSWTTEMVGSSAEGQVARIAGTESK